LTISRNEEDDLGDHNYKRRKSWQSTLKELATSQAKELHFGAPLLVMVATL
jgi:hypothetical protein